MRKLFPIFAILLGAFWVYMSFYYGLWVRRGPGGGFFPLVGGVLTVVFGLFYLVGEMRNPLPGHFDKKFIYPILATLGVLFVSYGIGLLPAMLLYILLWLRLYEKFTLKFSLSVALGAVVVLYGVFVYWLAVPLPRGAIHPILFG